MGQSDRLALEVGGLDDERTAVVLPAGRGLLATSEQKKLGLFSVTSFHLAQQTPMIVAAHPAAAVKQTIEACKSTRPELADAIAESVKGAIGRRREYDDT